MKIIYDIKMRGLLIEVTKEELGALATDLCREAGTEDLLQREIGHITYMETVTEQHLKKQAMKWSIGILLYWAALSAVMISGLYQIGKWFIAGLNW